MKNGTPYPMRRSEKNAVILFCNGLPELTTNVSIIMVEINVIQVNAASQK